MPAQPVIPNSQTQYSFDTSGNLIPTRTTHPLIGSFHGFASGRTELTGTPDYNVNWLPHNRPAVQQYRPGSNKKTKYKSGRGFEEPRDWGDPQEQDISGIGHIRPTPGNPPATLGDSDNAHNLFNVRARATPGTDMAAAAGTSPSSSFAGGGGWERIAGQLGSATAALGARVGYDLSNVRERVMPGTSMTPGGASPSQSFAGQGMGRVTTRRVGTGFAGTMGPPTGAKAPGTQFSGIPGAPKPFGELPPAGGSSYTYKTETSGKRAGQMGWDF